MLTELMAEMIEIFWLDPPFFIILFVCAFVAG